MRTMQFLKKYVIVIIVSVLIIPLSGSMLNATIDESWCMISSRFIAPRAMEGTSDGGTIIAGQIERPDGSLDAVIIKFYEDGDIEWQKYYSTEGRDSLYSIRETADGGYICSGTWEASYLTYNGTYSHSLSEWILKVDRDGCVEWTKTFDGGHIIKIDQTDDGGYIALGPKLIMRLDAKGEIVWRKIVLFDGYSSGNICIKKTADRGFVLLTYDVSADPEKVNFQSRLYKLDSSGSIEWEKSYEHPYQGIPTITGGIYDASLLMKNVIQTSDGGYIMTGSTEPDPIEEALKGDVDHDICVIKTDHLGEIEWCKEFGRSVYIYGELTDKGISIMETEKGDFFVLGSTMFSYEKVTSLTGLLGGVTIPVTDSWIWLLKLNSEGKVLWARSYDDDCKDDNPTKNYFLDDPIDMARNSAGGLTIAGKTTSYSSDTCLLLFNTDPDGDITGTDLQVRKTKIIVNNYYPYVLDAESGFEDDDDYKQHDEMEWIFGIANITMEDL